MFLNEMQSYKLFLKNYKTYEDMYKKIHAKNLELLSEINHIFYNNIQDYFKYHVYDNDKHEKSILVEYIKNKTNIYFIIDTENNFYEFFHVNSAGKPYHLKTKIRSEFLEKVLNFDFYKF